MGSGLAVCAGGIIAQMGRGDGPPSPPILGGARADGRDRLRARLPTLLTLCSPQNWGAGGAVQTYPRSPPRATIGGEALGKGTGACVWQSHSCRGHSAFCAEGADLVTRNERLWRPPRRIVGRSQRRLARPS